MAVTKTVVSITRFMCSDGEVFHDEQEAVEHENELSKIDEYEALINSMRIAELDDFVPLGRNESYDYTWIKVPSAELYDRLTATPDGSGFPVLTSFPAVLVVESNHPDWTVAIRYEDIKKDAEKWFEHVKRYIGKEAE